MLEPCEDFRVTPVWGICSEMKHHLNLDNKETRRINWIIRFPGLQTCLKGLRISKPEIPHLSHFAALWGLLWSALMQKCWQELWKALQLPAIRWHRVSNWVLRAGGQVTESPKQLAWTLNGVTSEIHLTGQGCCCWQKKKGWTLH